jgi:hypothetical protein
VNPDDDTQLFPPQDERVMLPVAVSNRNKPQAGLITFGFLVIEALLVAILVKVFLWIP